MIKENQKDFLSLRKDGNNYIVYNNCNEPIELVTNIIKPGDSFKATKEAVEQIMRSGGLPYRMRNALLVEEGHYDYGVGKRFELPPEKLVIRIF